MAVVSGAPDWVPDWLLLTPEAAAQIAAFFLVLFIIIDLYASDDKIPGNTPRELLLRLAKWKSSRRYVPLTGAFAPFGVEALVGHFFHPWSGVGPFGSDFPGLLAILGVGGLLAYLTWRFESPIKGGKWVVRIALLGLVAGAVLWPVGA